MSKLSTLIRNYKSKKKISCITAYDASMAKFLESQGIQIILVGDSLGQVIKGHNSTHSVSLKEIIYHARCVKAGVRKSILMVDLPKNTYSSKRQGLNNSTKILDEKLADIIKLEVHDNLEIVEYLINKGVPVCAHLGLLPQSIYGKSGFRKYGKQKEEANMLINNARKLDTIGAKIILLECVDNNIARKISNECTCPVIGIGSGHKLDGQVAVIYDLLGISFNKISSLSKNNSKHIEKIIKNTVNRNR